MGQHFCSSAKKVHAYLWVRTGDVRVAMIAISASFYLHCMLISLSLDKQQALLNLLKRCKDTEDQFLLFDMPTANENIKVQWYEHTCGIVTIQHRYQLFLIQTNKVLSLFLVVVSCIAFFCVHSQLSRAVGRWQLLCMPLFILCGGGKTCIN